MRIKHLLPLLLFALILVPTVHADEKPSPYFINPQNTDTTNPDTIIITENIVSIQAIDLTGEDDIVSATFEYQQEEYKWIYLGFDNDPLQPSIQFNGTGPTNSLGGTIWSTQWILNILGEDDYTLRVTLTDRNGNTGSTVLQVYYDPTPPSLTHDYNADRVEIHGNQTIQTIITGNNINSLKSSTMGPYPLETIHGNHGDANQHDVGEDNYDVNNYSGPTAAANALWRFLPNNLHENANHLAKTMAPLMKTDKVYGTATVDLTNGLRTYLVSNELEDTITLTPYISTVQPDGKITGKPTWKPYWKALLGNSSPVLLLSRPGQDQLVATTDDNTLYYTGYSGNPYTLDVGLLHPDSSTRLNGKLVPSSDKNGFKAIWIDENSDGQQDQDETWYLLALWSITSNQDTWTPITQDTTPLDGLNNHWDTSLVDDGLYYVKTEATDIRGTTSASYITFYVNNNLPTESILESPSISQIGQTTAALRWTSNPDNDFHHYEVLCNGTLQATVYKRIPVSTLVTGLQPETIYNVTLRTYDASGDYTTSSILMETKPTASGTTEIDTETPQVTITSPLTGLTSSNDIVLEWTTSEPVMELTYKLDLYPAVTIDSSEVNLDNLSEGVHTLHLTAKDYSGNIGQSQVTFTVDSIAPIIGAPIWRTIGEGDSMILNIGATVTDASELESVICSVTIGSTLHEYPMTLDSGVYRCSFTVDENDLPFVFQLSATDIAGNEAVNNNQGQHFVINSEPEEETGSIPTNLLLGGLVLMSIATIAVLINFYRKQ